MRFTWNPGGVSQVGMGETQDTGVPPVYARLREVLLVFTAAGVAAAAAAVVTTAFTVADAAAVTAAAAIVVGVDVLRGCCLSSEGV